MPRRIEGAEWCCFVCDTGQEADVQEAGHLFNNEPYCHECREAGYVLFCDDCEQDYTHDEVVSLPHIERTVCDGCMDSYVECYHCGESYYHDDTITPSDMDGSICSSCADDCLTMCQECEESVYVWYTYNDERLCRTCVQDHTRESLREALNCGEPLCSDCAELLETAVPSAYDCNLNGRQSGGFTCNQCGSIRNGIPAGSRVTQALWLLGETTTVICARCSMGDGEGAVYRIHSYSYRPNPLTMNRCDRDLENRALYFGSEVEIEMARDADRNAALRQLAEEDQQYKLFFCKSDSSISHGFELVTHPFTFDWMKENHEAFVPMFNLGKVMRGWDSTNCGMHVHMTKDAFSNLHIMKFAKFFFKHPDFITAISKRPVNRLEQWARIGNPEEKALYKWALGSQRNGLGLGRGALALERSGTIECRIFRSTLSQATYYGNIEFLQALFDYTKLCGIEDMELEMFLDFVHTRGKAYKNFINLTETIRPEAINEEMECV